MPKATRFQSLAAALVSCVAILSFGPAPTFAQRSPVDPGNSNNASACATCAYYAVDNTCSYTQQTVQGTQVSLVFVNPANAQAPNCVPRLVDNCPPSGGGSTPPGIESENQKWKMFGTRLRNIAPNQAGQGDIYLGYRDLGIGNGRQQYGTGDNGNQLVWATGSYSVKFQYDPVADTVKTFLGNINTATLTSFSSNMANRACTGCSTEQCGKCTLATINTLEVYLSNSGAAPAQIQLSNIKINGSPASPAALSIQQQPGFGTFYPLSGITSGLTVELDMNLNRSGMSGGAESVKVEIQVGCNLDKSTAPYCS